MKLQASGRVISSRNASRLKGLFSEIGSILVDAKVLNTTDLKRILDEELEELAEQVDEEDDTEIAAGSLGEMIKRNSFQVIINQALDNFRFCLSDLAHCPEERLEKRYGSDKTRTQVAKEMIDDLASFLQEQISQLPSPIIQDYPFDYPVYASAKSSQLEVLDNLDTEEPVILAQAEESDKGVEVELVFRCELSENIEASASDFQSGNKMPIHGVLFLVDEVSEFAPSKGSDYPLYVPRAIAEVAAEAINNSGGLPLDAHDSLAQHANQGIVGVMTSANIVGNEFWVSGHLFPWNNQEKVSLISANSKVLGMSMNAHAKTHLDTVNGKKVSHVDSLNILGANILYAEKATYQKTKIQIPGSVIAASSNQESQKENMELDKQFEGIRSMLNELILDSKRSNEKLEAIEQRTASNEKIIAEIQAERTERDSTIAAQKREEKEKEKEERLLQALGKMITDNNDSLKKEIMETVGTGNRRQQPQRRAGGLVDIVAQSGGTGLSGLHLELHDAQTRLNTLREAGVVGVERARLIEQISSLKAQIAANS